MNLTKLITLIALFAFTTLSSVSSAEYKPKPTNPHGGTGHGGHHGGSHHGDKDGNGFLKALLMVSLLKSLTDDVLDDENKFTLQELQDSLANEIILNDGEVESAEIQAIVDDARSLGVSGSDREIAEKILEASYNLK